MQQSAFGQYEVDHLFSKGREYAFISDKHSADRHDEKIFRNINKRSNPGAKITLFAASPAFTLTEAKETKELLKQKGSSRLTQGRTLTDVHVLDVGKQFADALPEFYNLCKWHNTKGHDTKGYWPILERASPIAKYTAALNRKIVRVQGFRRSGKSVLVSKSTPRVFTFNLGKHRPSRAFSTCRHLLRR